MNAHDLPESLKEAGSPVVRVVEPPPQLEEPWFDEPAPGSQRRSSAPPPVVHVGEFLGDPLADAWLR